MPVDYRSFGPGGASNAEAPDSRWWKLKGDDAAASITANLKLLHENQSPRLMQQMISSRLYGNATLLGMAGLTGTRLATVQTALKDRISYNVVASAIDTIGAKIGKNKPKPLFLTSGGDYRLQRKAKKLNQFTEGVFYENDVYRLGGDVFRDGCVGGTGAAFVYNHKGRVRIERALASEMYVDEVEALYGEPRQLHRVKVVDRAVASDFFPNARTLIASAKGAKADEVGLMSNVSDMLVVRESWHLPSGEDANDGRRIISIDDGVLLSEPYEKQYFPFAFFHWSKRLYGFWGQGLAEQLQNIQLEINKLLWIIQRSMHLAGSFKVLMENTSKIVKEHLNNDIGAVVTYTGTPPQYVVPPAVPPEIYQHLLTLKTAAYEQAGISMLSAASQKPAGLNSGKALREYNDIESDRFTTVGHAYENFYLDLAKLAISTVKDITEAGKKSYPVKVPGRKFLQTIDWKDVDLDEDEYVMQCYPVSSLPNDPAGRLQTVQEYMQAGLISPRQGKRLLDFPDLDQVEGLQNASEDYATEILEKIVDEGIYTPPEGFDDLQLMRELALEFYARGKTQKLEPERLEMLIRFIDQVDYEQSKAMAPQAAAGAPGAPAGPAGAPPGGPQAAPMAPPQSDLLPNAPGVTGLQ